MEKNENGFSEFNYGPSRLNCRGERRDEAENGGSISAPENGMNGNGQMLMGDCNGGPHNFQLAMVYAPTQCFRMTYSHSDALKNGTLFEELYKPLGEAK